MFKVGDRVRINPKYVTPDSGFSDWAKEKAKSGETFIIESTLYDDYRLKGRPTGSWRAKWLLPVKKVVVLLED